jgi:hypothetical protein
MPRRLVVVVAVLAVAAAALAPGARAAAPRHCLPRGGEHVAARSSQAVLLLDRTGTGLVGCSRRSGGRLEMAGPSTGGDLPASVGDVHLRGTAATYSIDLSDRYDSFAKLYLDDAVHAGRRRDVADSPFAQVTLGPGHTVAWVADHARISTLYAWRGGTVRRADQAFALSRVRFTATRLVWRHGGEGDRAWPLGGVDRCGAGGERGGTTDVAITASVTGVVACWRPTGATRTIAATDPAVAVGGSWVAVSTGASTDRTTIRTELAGGATDTVATPGGASLVVDPHGSLAWLGVRDDLTGLAPLYAHDAGGTRVVDPATRESFIGLDGSALLWGRRAAPLSPAG